MKTCASCGETWHSDTIWCPKCCTARSHIWDGIKSEKAQIRCTPAEMAELKATALANRMTIGAYLMWLHHKNTGAFQSVEAKP